MIQDINPDTPFPVDLEFETVHFKWIRLESKSIVLKLRDFPQFFVEVKHILSWGRVVLAEQSPTARSLRRQKIRLGHPKSEDVTIIRSLHTFKMYQDLALDMNYFAFSHGPCWEPIIAQVSLAFNYLTGLYLRHTIHSIHFYG